MPTVTKNVANRCWVLLWQSFISHHSSSSSTRNIELCKIALSRSVDIHLFVHMILSEEGEERILYQWHLNKWSKRDCIDGNIQLATSGPEERDTMEQKKWEEPKGGGGKSVDHKRDWESWRGINGTGSHKNYIGQNGKELLPRSREYQASPTVRIPKKRVATRDTKSRCNMDEASPFGERGVGSWAVNKTSQDRSRYKSSSGSNIYEPRGS